MPPPENPSEGIWKYTFVFTDITQIDNALNDAPYAGMIQIRFMGRRKHLPLSPLNRTPLVANYYISPDWTCQCVRILRQTSHI